jgi:hypothetical protein
MTNEGREETGSKGKETVTGEREETEKVRGRSRGRRNRMMGEKGK